MKVKYAHRCYIETRTNCPQKFLTQKERAEQAKLQSDKQTKNKLTTRTTYIRTGIKEKMSAICLHKDENKRENCNKKDV